MAASGDAGPRPVSVGRGALRGAAYLALLAIGTGTGYLVWDAVRLPFRNPMNVVGPLAIDRFNPANNQIRFFLFVFLPSILLAAIALPRPGRISRLLFDGARQTGPVPVNAAPRALRAGLFIATLVFAALASLSVPTYHASGAFDTFHEGESLGMAVSLEHGKAPYEDAIFLHGLYQDPYRSMFAFQLFGRSIGAQRTLESMTKVAGWVLLAAFVVFVFGQDYRIAVPALAALILAQREFSTFFYKHLIDSTFVCDPRVFIIFPPRDIVLMVFLLALLALHTLGKRDAPPALGVGAAGSVLAFAAVGAFAYSVDRGFYLTAAFAFAAPVLYGAYFRRPCVRWLFPASCALGIAAAGALLGYLLGWRYGAFAQFVFQIMPRYKELSDGRVFDIAFAPNQRIALVYAIVTLWLAGRLFREIHCKNSIVRGAGSFLRNYLIETVLLFLAALYFRSALGRTDWEHIVYSSLPIGLLACLIAGKHIVGPLLGPQSTPPADRQPPPPFIARYATHGIMLLALLLSCAVLADDARRAHLARANFPAHVADTNFVPPRYRAAIDFLNTNLGPGDSFFTLTSEASWYYLLDRPAPGRFPVVWFATPEAYQRELVEDLRAAPPTFVIYKGPYPLIDGISHEERYPILMAYLLREYRPITNLDGVEIWGRIQ